MGSIWIKELKSFFDSLIGYMTIGVFLILMGLIMWVFPDYSILNYNFATLNQLFDIAPMIFLFLIPAVCMKAFSEEKQFRTIDLLFTKPVTTWQIVLGKYLAALTLVVIALLPTLLYYYSVYQLGAPPGNIDNGEVMGSYLGLFMLSSVFVSIGLLASAMSTNQIVAFLLASLLSFIIFYGFYFISKLSVFIGVYDDLIQKLGIDYHYRSISRGLIDTRDLVYFISITILFLVICTRLVENEKNS